MVGVQRFTAGGAISWLNPDFAHDSAVSVLLDGFNPHVLSSHELRKILSGDIPVGLTPLWRINTAQPNFVLGLVIIEDLDRIAIGDGHDSSHDICIGEGWNQREE